MLNDPSDQDGSLRPSTIFDRRFWRGFTIGLALLIAGYGLGIWG